MDAPALRRVGLFYLAVGDATRWPPWNGSCYAAEWAAMTKRLTITFPAGRDQFFYSRVLDFGESLHSPIVRGGLGRLCGLDRFTQVIWVEFSDPHNLGRLKAIVRKELGRSNLTADAIVSIGNDGTAFV